MRSKFHLSIVSLMVSWALGGVSLAAAPDKGSAAAARGDFATAVALWRKAAESGDAESQLFLAGSLILGRGVAKDQVEAAKWLLKSAGQHNVTAEELLGTVHAGGMGVPQDFQEATRWWRLAADDGSASAEAFLATAYEFGTGVPKDYGQAVEWCRKSAEHGSPVGQLNLGRLYLEGKALPPDEAEALRWVLKAANQGLPSAQVKAGQLYASGVGTRPDPVQAYKWYSLGLTHNPTSMAGREENVAEFDGLTAKMTAAQIGVAKRLAADWMPK